MRRPHPCTTTTAGDRRVQEPDVRIAAFAWLRDQRAGNGDVLSDTRLDGPCRLDDIADGLLNYTY